MSNREETASEGTSTTKEGGRENSIATKEKGFLGTLLGPFTTKEFWVGLMSHLAQQALAAFLSALGGVLVYYGKKTFNTSMTTTTAGSGGEDVANRAFSGSFAPAPTFHDDFRPGRYNVDNTPRGDSRFPGFGR